MLTEAELALYRDQIPDAEWTVVQLRLTDDDVLRARIGNHRVRFGMTGRQIDYWIGISRDEGPAFDAESFVDHVIDTDELDREAVTDRVLESVGWS